MSVIHSGIYGSTVASEMLHEYYAVFSRNTPSDAVRKLDDFVRREYDMVDWPDYSLSLANFMWHRGILTDEVRRRALDLLDSGAGLLLWEEADADTYRQREKELALLRDTMMRPQPPAKGIRMRLVTKPLFCTGDVLALQLRTADKAYVTEPDAYPSGIDEAQFRAYDGKWIAIRKVQDFVLTCSRIEPEVRDVSPVFQLYHKIFDECPTLQDLQNVSVADTGILGTPTIYGYRCRNPLGLFWCDGRIKPLQQRNCTLLGNDMEDLYEAVDMVEPDLYVSFSQNSPWGNAETALLKALLPYDEEKFFERAEDDTELPF